jgi:flavin reductase (DIM6/NTAB) family NADH-FMN oxidoreductase RutF
MDAATIDQDLFYEWGKEKPLRHDPIKAIVAPRPIGWISTVDRQGRPNLAPYSFFNNFSSSPPIVAFSSEIESDSVDNAEATGEFVFNLVSLDLARVMNGSSEGFPPGVSEFQEVAIERAPSRLVKPPRVAASPAALECKTLQVLQLKDLDGRPIRARMVLGQVVGVHIRKEFLTNGQFDTAKAQPVARCGYLADYAVVTELFELPRPRFTPRQLTGKRDAR